VMTGDYLNRSLTEALGLRQLAASLPRPCFATLGNHDHWSGAAGVRAALTRAGVRVLTNESLVVSGAGFRVTLVGIDDGYTGHHAIRQAFAGLAAPRDTLVLTHYPNLARLIAPYGGRLILAGHTHGGTVRIPILTVAIARAMGVPYLAGWYDVGPATRLYVNVGIGQARSRARIGAQAAPEIAVFELAPPARR